MNSNTVENLTKALELLKKLDSQAILDGISTQYLEIELISEHNEIRINGNAEGLIYLSRVFLEVAFKNEVGSHFHIDETGVPDKCDAPIVVCLKEASWDK